MDTNYIKLSIKWVFKFKLPQKGYPCGQNLHFRSKKHGIFMTPLSGHIFTFVRKCGPTTPTTPPSATCNSKSFSTTCINPRALKTRGRIQTGTLPTIKDTPGWQGSGPGPPSPYSLATNICRSPSVFQACCYDILWHTIFTTMLHSPMDLQRVNKIEPLYAELKSLIPPHSKTQ